MIRAQHRLWADFIFQPYLFWLLRRHFHTNSGFGGTPENPIALAVTVATESQYVVGWFFCLSAQQANFSSDCVSDDA